MICDGRRVAAYDSLMPKALALLLKEHSEPSANQPLCPLIHHSILSPEYSYTNFFWLPNISPFTQPRPNEIIRIIQKV